MENKQETCPCKRVSCPRYGNCAACREYHYTSKRKPLTYCDKREKKQRKAERKARKAL